MDFGVNGFIGQIDFVEHVRDVISMRYRTDFQIKKCLLCMCLKAEMRISSTKLDDFG